MHKTLNMITDVRKAILFDELASKRLQGLLDQSLFYLSEAIMNKQKTVRELDAEIERLKRKVEIAELKKKLKKTQGGKR